MKKYEFTGETKVWLGITLHRIRALVAFGDVDVGDLGGWIEKEENLAQEGEAWVSGEALVCDEARVCGEAKVSGEARVYGKANVCGKAWVSGEALVCDEARVEKPWHCITIGLIGSRNDTTTFFRTKSLEIFVACGCFRGNIEEFAEAVKKRHGGTKHEKVYLAAIELAKLQIDLTEGTDLEKEMG